MEEETVAQGGEGMHCRMRAKLDQNQVSVWAQAPGSPVDANWSKEEAEKGAQGTHGPLPVGLRGS